MTMGTRGPRRKVRKICQMCHEILKHVRESGWVDKRSSGWRKMQIIWGKIKKKIEGKRLGEGLVHLGKAESNDMRNDHVVER